MTNLLLFFLLLTVLIASSPSDDCQSLKYASWDLKNDEDFYHFRGCLSAGIEEGDLDLVSSFLNSAGSSATYMFAYAVRKSMKTCKPQVLHHLLTHHEGKISPEVFQYAAASETDEIIKVLAKVDFKRFTGSSNGVATGFLTICIKRGLFDLLTEILQKCNEPTKSIIMAYERAVIGKQEELRAAILNSNIFDGTHYWEALTPHHVQERKMARKILSQCSSNRDLVELQSLVNFIEIPFLKSYLTKAIRGGQYRILVIMFERLKFSIGPMEAYKLFQLEIKKPSTNEQAIRSFADHLPSLIQAPDLIDNIWKDASSNNLPLIIDILFQCGYKPSTDETKFVLTQFVQYEPLSVRIFKEFG